MMPAATTVPPADRPGTRVAVALAAFGGWVSRDEVVACVGIFAPSTVRRELARLVHAGRADAAGEGSARRWRWKETMRCDECPAPVDPAHDIDSFITDAAGRVERVLCAHCRERLGIKGVRS
jgi:hypothetical protein